MTIAISYLSENVIAKSMAGIDPRRPEHSILNLHSSSEAWPRRVAIAGDILGLHLPDHSKVNRDGNLQSATLGRRREALISQDPRFEWTLRWILKSMRSQEDNTKLAPFYAESWSLLVQIIPQCHIRTLARHIRDFRLVDSIRVALEYALAGQRESLQSDHEADHGDCDNGLDLGQEETSKQTLCLRPLKNFKALFVSICQVLSLLVPPTQADGNSPEPDAHDHVLLSYALQGSPEEWSKVLAAGVKYTQAAVVDDFYREEGAKLEENNVFNIEGHFNSIIKSWSLQASLANNGSTFDVDCAFDRIALAPCLALWSALSTGEIGRQVSAVSITQALISLIQKHTLSPRWTDFNSIKTEKPGEQYSAVRPRPSITSLLLSDNLQGECFCPQIKSLEKISTEMLILHFRLAIYWRYPRSSIQRVTQDSWLESLVKDIFEALNDVPKEKKSSSILLISMLQILRLCSEYMLKISDSIICKIVRRALVELEGSLENESAWSVIGSCLEINADSVVLPALLDLSDVNSRFEDLQMDDTTLMSRLLAIVHETDTNTTDSEIKDKVSITIILPLLKAFCRSRKLNAFLLIWRQQLQKFDRTSTECDLTSRASIWELPELVQMIARAARQAKRTLPLQAIFSSLTSCSGESLRTEGVTNLVLLDAIINGVSIDLQVSEMGSNIEPLLAMLADMLKLDKVNPRRLACCWSISSILGQQWTPRLQHNVVKDWLGGFGAKASSDLTAHKVLRLENIRDADMTLLRQMVLFLIHCLSLPDVLLLRANSPAKAIQGFYLSLCKRVKQSPENSNMSMLFSSMIVDLSRSKVNTRSIFGPEDVEQILSLVFDLMTIEDDMNAEDEAVPTFRLHAISPRTAWKEISNQRSFIHIDGFEDVYSRLVILKYCDAVEIPTNKMGSLDRQYINASNALNTVCLERVSSAQRTQILRGVLWALRLRGTSIALPSVKMHLHLIIQLLELGVVMAMINNSSYQEAKDPDSLHILKDSDLLSQIAQLEPVFSAIASDLEIYILLERMCEEAVRCVGHMPKVPMSRHFPMDTDENTKVRAAPSRAFVGAQISGDLLGILSSEKGQRMENALEAEIVFLRDISSQMEELVGHDSRDVLDLYDIQLVKLVTHIMQRHIYLISDLYGKSGSLKANARVEFRDAIQLLRDCIKTISKLKNLPKQAQIEIQRISLLSGIFSDNDQGNAANLDSLRECIDATKYAEAEMSIRNETWTGQVAFIQRYMQGRTIEQRVRIISEISSTASDSCPRETDFCIIRVVLRSLAGQNLDQHSFVLGALLEHLCRSITASKQHRAHLMAMQCLDLFLSRLPKIVQQKHVDSLLGHLAYKARELTSKLKEKSSTTVFTASCRILSTLLRLHRSKVTTRYHLLIPCLGALLQCLYIPHTLPSMHQPYDTYFRQNHAEQLTSILTQTCDPSVASIHQSKKRKRAHLHDQREDERHKAGEFLRLLVHTYCNGKLHGKLEPEIDVVLKPAIWLIIDVMNERYRKVMRAGMHIDCLGVFDAVYGEYKRTKTR